MVRYKALQIESRQNSQSDRCLQAVRAVQHGEVTSQDEDYCQ
jgi:hypothetical protein